MTTMNALEKNVYDLLTGTAKSLDLKIVNIEIFSKQTTKLIILLEKNNGESVSLDECSEFSKLISSILDAYDAINEQYNLEVSSCGVNRPLFTLEDYKRFTGSEVVVILKRSLTNGQKRLIATLQSVIDDQYLTLLFQNGHSENIAINNIKKINLNIIK